MQIKAALIALATIAIMISSGTAVAGYKTNIAFAGAETIALGIAAEIAISRTILPAVENASLIPGAVSYILSANKYAKYIAAEALISVVITMANTKYATNANAILGETGYLDDHAYRNEIAYRKDNYESHVPVLTTLAHKIDMEPQAKCRGGNNIYTYPSGVPLQDIHKPARIWDYGPYKELKKSARVGDKLEHDHIPSIAAIYKYLESRDGIDTRENPSLSLIIKNNTTALEITKDMHKLGRTYGSKNTYINLGDSKNLRLATIKDMAYHLANNYVLSKEMLGAFAGVYYRNRLLCLYGE